MTKNNVKEKHKKKIIDVKSWEEADAIVLRLLNEGYNYRDIVKIKFRLGNEVRGNNLKKIFEISKKRSMNSYVDVNKKYYNQTDVLKKIFKLLKERTPIEDILIKYGDPKLVSTALEEYKKNAGYELVPKRIIDNLRTELSIAGNCNTYDGLLKAATKARYSHYLRIEHPYMCKYCGEPELMGENEFKRVQYFFPRDNWGHDNCLIRNGDQLGRIF